MKKEEITPRAIINFILSLALLIAFLRFTGLYSVFLNAIKEVPSFIKSCIESLKGIAG
jgi:hypothetical protein